MAACGSSHVVVHRILEAADGRRIPVVKLDEGLDLLHPGRVNGAGELLRLPPDKFRQALEKMPGVLAADAGLEIVRAGNQVRCGAEDGTSADL